MDFLFYFNKVTNQLKDTVCRINPTDLTTPIDSPLLQFNYLNQQSYYNLKCRWGEAFILGDLIIPPGKNKQDYLNEIAGIPAEAGIKELKGNFYLIILDREKQHISFFSSLFSILPIYFFQSNERFIASSSTEIMNELPGATFRLNKKFVIEKLLFNYAFLNDTIYQDLKTVSSNHYLRFNGSKSEQLKHTAITDYYSDNPVSWQKGLEPAAELLLHTIKNYFPREAFYITLTGGFDSRTITAVALKNQLAFGTFSYGVRRDKDLTIPEIISKQSGFEHETFLLDDNYAEKHYIRSLENILLKTDCNASIGRSHYAYIAEILATKTIFFLSGNFGSEIIRTMKVPGVMTSSFLLELFDNDNDQLLYQKLLESEYLKYFDQAAIKEQIEEIFNEITNYKKNLNPELTKNQKFYVYLFEEVFRKYFGPELVIQNRVGLINRTPYLDFEFITELLKTNLAGVNARYLENNPLMRFKGQMLYSFVLKKLGSPLQKYPTDRGYKPEDFFSLAGKINILINYIKKQRTLNQGESHNAICYNRNKDYFLRNVIATDFISKGNIDINSLKYSDEAAHLLSIILYINKKKIKSAN